MSYSVQQATKSDKKEILRFYRQQHYSARFLGFDTCYLIREERENHEQGKIIAAVIVSQLSEANQQLFLHALVVDKHRQKQGLAIKLLNHCQQQQQNIIAFCQPKLSALYLKAGFREIPSHMLTELLAKRYHSYIKKHDNLLIMYSE